MTDEPAAISTKIITPEGKLHFQEFWVSKMGEPEVSDVYFEGIEKAKPSEDVITAFMSEEVVLIGPSNPITSIGPILSLQGIREILKRKRVVAISPIVGTEPISGPAGKFMHAKGFEVSPYGVYKCYADFLDLLVIAASDECPKDVEVHKTDIILKNAADSEVLAKVIRDIIDN